MDNAHNPLAEVAAELTSARVTLAESNAQDARVQRQRFEALLGEFIDCAGPFEADDAHPMTNLMDMLAGMARDRSQHGGDRWFQISRCIAECAAKIEHGTREPQ